MVLYQPCRFALLTTIILTGLLLSAAVQAVEDDDLRFDTTEDLFQTCSVAPDSVEYLPASLACRGFIEGAMQYHDAVTDRQNMKRLVCYPTGTTIADGRAAFVAWAQTHSSDAKLMGEMPVIGLVRALAAAYPCNR